MHVYICTKDYGYFPGFRIKKKLPLRFYGAKNDEKYMEWKKKEQEKLEDKFFKKDSDCWWKSLDNKAKNHMLEIYKSKEIACSRRYRFLSPMSDLVGYKPPKKYKTIDSKFFSLSCDIFEKI